MNRDNIQYTIDTLKAAQNFDIRVFQRATPSLVFSPTKYAQDIEGLHICGNTACIAGYVGLTQRWRDLGGVCEQGIPSFPDLSDDELERGDHDHTIASLVRFWELPAEVVAAIIYGEGWRRFREAFKGLPGGWHHMTKDNAISMFEQLLAAKGE